MKIYKTMRKRGLALFLALTMCLSLIQTTAFANEEAEHAHNEGGWTCAYTDPVTEPACVHEHDAACGYIEAVEEIPCVCTGTDGEGSVVHEDGCAYAPAVEGAPCGHVCGGECAAVVTEGYWECTPPAGEPEDTEPTEDAEAPAGDAEVPAEVQAFLDAVAAIPAITAENAAEVAEYVYGPVSEAYDALLGTEYEERDDVMEAAEMYAAAIAELDAVLDMESENYYTPPLNGYDADDIFYVNGSPECYLYLGIRPNNVQSTWKNPSEDLSVLIGETEKTQRLYTIAKRCNRGHVLIETTAEWITLVPNKSDYFQNSNPEVISDVTWGLSSYVAEDTSDWNYEGFPALDIGFAGVKPGHTSLNFFTWHEYHYNENICYNSHGIYSSAHAHCRICNNIQGYDVSFNGWIRNEELINIDVKARYQLDYDAQGGTLVASTFEDVASESATLIVTSDQPTRTNYTFLGWADSPDAVEPNVSGSVTLYWEEGFGSKADPVTKTLYAVWEEDSATETYTVK